MAEQLIVPKRLSGYVAEFGPDIFATEVFLKCNFCDKAVPSKQKTDVTQHLQTAKHKKNVLKARGEQVDTIGQTDDSPLLSPKPNPYRMALSRMFERINVPLYKILHPEFCDFVKKYHRTTVPHASSPRETYLKEIYEETIRQIRSSINDSRIWISIDETTDIKGQCVVNTVVGCLRAGEPSSPFLLDLQIVEATNQSTIAQAFTNSLHLLWPEGIHHDRVLLFVSVSAYYMKLAAEALKVLFPRMIHLTCIVHGIERECEELRYSYQDLIGKLEGTTSPLMVRLGILKEVERSILSADGPEGVVIQREFWSVLGNNSGLATILQIQNSLLGGDPDAEIPHLTLDDIASFSHAPLASIDVERSFSQYKPLLSDPKLSLTPENAKYHLIPMCNPPDPETESNKKKKPPEVLRVVHLNVRTLRPVDKFDSLSEYYADLYDVICFAETKFKLPKPDVYQLDDFSHFAVCGSTSHGGVSVFFRKTMETRKEVLKKRAIQTPDECIQAVALQLKLRDKVLWLLAIYSCKSSLANELCEFVEEFVNKHDPPIILVGDLNVDLLADTPRVKKFKSRLSALGLRSTFETVTRPQSGTCLDQVWVTRDGTVEVLNTKVLPHTEFSDHLPVVFDIAPC